MEEKEEVLNRRREVRVVCFAVFSRLVLFCFSFLSANFIPDYDTSASSSLFFRLKTTTTASSSSSFTSSQEQLTILSTLTKSDGGGGGGLELEKIKLQLSELVVKSLSFQCRWDCLYFLQIAAGGEEEGGGVEYEWEQNHAFFPLLPLLLNLLHRPLLFLLHPKAALLLVGSFLSAFSFVLATFFFYRLSLLVFRSNKRLSFAASILFCISPASVFFSAIYTESLFALFGVTGLYLLELGQSRRLSSSSSYFTPPLCSWLASLLFGLATGVRSNGSLFCLFLCYDGLRHHPFRLHPSSWFSVTLQRLGVLLLSKRSRLEKKRYLSSSASFSSSSSSPFRILLLHWFGVGIRCLLNLIPLFAYQFYTYQLYCADTTTINRPWCDAIWPDVYSFVQAKHWLVGLFRYYQFSQIPNFLLAGPMLGISCFGVIGWLRTLRKRWNSSREERFTILCSELQLCSLSPSTSSLLSFSSSSEKPRQDWSENNKSTFSTRYFSASCGIYVAHWGFLVLIAVLVMNIQVVTRFVATCPALYWFAATLLLRSSEREREPKIRSDTGRVVRRHDGGRIEKLLVWVLGRGVLFYFGLYSVLGCVLYPNFYPWT